MGNLLCVIVCVWSGTKDESGERKNIYQRGEKGQWERDLEECIVGFFVER